MIVYCSNNKAYMNSCNLYNKVIEYIIQLSKKKKNIQVHNFICSLKFQKQNIILGCMEYF